MKKGLLSFIIICFFTATAFAQTKFSAETSKYIEYNEPVMAFKNALLIGGTGNAAKAHQTIIINKGKIDWVGDDANAIIPKEAKTIDLNGKALMRGLVMTHEHMYIYFHCFLWAACSLYRRNVSTENPIYFPLFALSFWLRNIWRDGSLLCQLFSAKSKRSQQARLLPGRLNLSYCTDVRKHCNWPVIFKRK